MTKSKRHLNSHWIDTKSAAAALGCTRIHLLNLKADGLLKCGVHWKDIRRPSSRRATYRWHLKRCAEVLEEPPEKRGN